MIKYLLSAVAIAVAPIPVQAQTRVIEIIQGVPTVSGIRDPGPYRPRILGIVRQAPSGLAFDVEEAPAAPCGQQFEVLSGANRKTCFGK